MMKKKYICPEAFEIEIHTQGGILRMSQVSVSPESETEEYFARQNYGGNFWRSCSDNAWE